MAENKDQKPETLLVAAGRDPQRNRGAVNVPPYRASTIVHPDYESFEAARHKRFEKDTIVYGRFGTPATQAFEDAVAALEGGDRCVAVSSGMAACITSILAVVKGGDHVLLPDNVYQPVRLFAGGFLSRFGVESSFYDPSVGAGISALLKPNTRLVYCESPGSQTMEMADTPAIVAAAKAHGAYTAFDGTWATPLLFRPLDHGIDLSINAATKYYVGHSDAMLGTIAMREALFERVKTTAAAQLGNCPGSEEIYLGLRGLRTLAVRIERNGRNALAVAQWLQKRPEIARVLFPALPGDPGHAIWKRDFLGSTGLFSVILKSHDIKAVAAMLDGMELFGLGFSWGGYESLIIPFDCRAYRTATKWEPEGLGLRLQIGFEDLDDLKADLDRGFARYRAALG